MPSFSRGKKRENLVYIPINDFLYFGFKSKDFSTLSGISATDISALGHLPSNATFAGKIKIIGSNAPKPPRVSKKLSNANVSQQQSASTFCAYSSLGDAQAVGWKLIKGRQNVNLKAISTTKGSLTGIAELSDDSLYCFPINKADFDLYGAELGLKSAVDITTENERKKLVSGSSIPYPGRASKKLTGGASFSSFFSSEKLEDLSTAGYDVLSEEFIFPIEIVPFLR